MCIEFSKCKGTEYNKHPKTSKIIIKPNHGDGEVSNKSELFIYRFSMKSNHIQYYVQMYISVNRHWICIQTQVNNWMRKQSTLNIILIFFSPYRSKTSEEGLNQRILKKMQYVVIITISKLKIDFFLNSANENLFFSLFWQVFKNRFRYYLYRYPYFYPPMKRYQVNTHPFEAFQWTQTQIF